MTMTGSPFSTILTVICLFLVSGTAECLSRGQRITGRIVVLRPVDSAQWGSIVKSNERFIVQIADGRSRRLIEIVYSHFGYSDLKGDYRDAGKPISLVLKRSPRCDQKFSEFEAEAPVLHLTGDSEGVSERVVFTTDLRKIDPAYRLKCYELKGWTPLP